MLKILLLFTLISCNVTKSSKKYISMKESCSELERLYKLDRNNCIGCSLLDSEDVKNEFEEKCKKPLDK